MASSFFSGNFSWPIQLRSLELFNSQVLNNSKLRSLSVSGRGWEGKLPETRQRYCQVVKVDFAPVAPGSAFDACKAAGTCCPSGVYGKSRRQVMVNWFVKSW